MENEALISVVTQSGAIGICVLLIIYIWKRDKMESETIQALAHSVQSLSEAVSELRGVIRGCGGNKLNK